MSGNVIRMNTPVIVERGTDLPLYYRNWRDGFLGFAAIADTDKTSTTATRLSVGGLTISLTPRDLHMKISGRARILSTMREPPEDLTASLVTLPDYLHFLSGCEHFARNRRLSLWFAELPAGILLFMVSGEDVLTVAGSGAYAP